MEKRVDILARQNIDIMYSSEPIELDKTSGSIPHFLFEHSNGTLVDGLSGRRLEMEELKVRSRALASVLSARGIGVDSVVLIYAPNHVEFGTVVFATQLIGGIVSPANPTYTVSELKYQMKDTKAKIVFAHSASIDNARAAAESLGISRENVLSIDQDMDSLVTEGLKRGPVAEYVISHEQSKTKLAFLNYSSGTTGLPKGVMITHFNIVANLQQTAVQFSGKGEPDMSKALGLLPLFHIYALTCVFLYNIYRSHEVIILPKFDMPTLLKTIEKYKLTFLYLVPPIVIALINMDITKNYDLSSVQLVLSGAAPLTSETALELQRKFPTWHIRQGYGMTESSPLATTTKAMDEIPGSIGNLLPGMQAKIIGSDGTEITEFDKPGELYLHGPNVTFGYFHNEKATKETFKPGGWLATGDEVLTRKSPKTGAVHFFIVDRKKELIKVKGFQVAPAELEGHILDHPAVADCCVISVPHARNGEAPRAFIVPKQSFNASKELAHELIDHVKKHKSEFKWLTGGIVFVKEIPKSASGKILRRLLRDAKDHPQAHL